ncbi:hypothetical protein BCR41DRAFT_38448 [Lobosporangium transversale]|uniref:FAD-binding FR-type domain-containing protein n=1 Tax=Lobosporangium transversale TaxID=64571 RepID=A0A1Y2GQC3_9FUNG|nr:hypothetical protein BCR41DRAFT_38448 [Lobosporangium transversale]ORZ19095.1 hypothetical protein BCR41DRAFT_38448 [Lobosporangium transversale]|eukprot:XP_021882263.1 hypothetical protein BCR41DRAFT_38448 [Lobosporangium transversale]
MHFPYYMIWYYVLPSVCLYLADRFVPKFIQSISMAPEVECSFNKEADILTMVLSSRDRMEPLKPYYPGDYVNVEIPELSIVPHPFTIASYWAEDPYSMTLYIRTFQETRTSWTGALANMCCEREKDQDRPLLLKAKVDGVFGDRNHDYLSTKYMVIFSAGAAITTFMPLLKAMAAQIEAAAKVLDNPETIRVYLICTFRYESELYAYGDFMHRIIHDHRFNSWLHTQIYISRPDKGTPPVECPSGQCSSEFVCGRIENEENGDIVESVKVKVSESTSLLSYGFKGKSRYGAISTNCSGRNDRGKGCCMEADTAVSAGSSASSITLTSNTSPCAPEAQTIVTFAAAAADHDAIYRHRALPTFPAASSSIIATVHAKKDLVATTLILIVPMFIYVWARAIPWEGTYRGETHWCRTTIEHDQHMTNRCLWSYSMLPGFLHIISACVFGYLGLWVARSTNLFGRSDKRSIAKSKSTKRSNLSARDAYKNLLNGLSALDLEAAVDRSLLYDRRTSDGNNNSHRTTEVPKESIPFLRGRIQVNHHIQELKGMGIGLEDMNDNLVGQGGDVLVFGGGPDAFVNMIGESCKKAAWKVDYHRETWAP